MLGKNFLYSILVGLSLVGCASGPTLSPEEEKVLISTCMGDDVCLFAERASMIEKKKEEIKYEQIVRRDEEEDAIRALVEWCKIQSQLTILYQGPSSIRCRAQNKRRNASLCIPRHARLMDYKCVDTRELMRTIERRMRGGF